MTSAQRYHRSPARTLGASVASLAFPTNTWLYYVGQYLGSVLATLVCQYLSSDAEATSESASADVLLKQMDYHEVVAAIDSADNTKSADVDSSPIGGLMNKCGQR